MSTTFCTVCGNSISLQAVACPGCGQPNSSTASASSYPGDPKSRVTAGVLALLVGGLGVHKFYLNKIGLGVIYLIFIWTFIPAIIAFVEGIIYLTQSDEAFSKSQGVNTI